MSLIAIAVYDTEENKRTEYTKRTLSCLMNTVNMTKHRIHVIDNASCAKTKRVLEDFAPFITIHTLGQNLGTAKAINKAWEYRKEGEHAIKMDNDVIIHQKNWADELELAIELDDNIGIVGLKRKDCWERPDNPNEFYKSELKLLGGANHKWLPIEKVHHVMGTCQMYNSRLLDGIGYLYQPRLYGFDDALAAVRCQVAGFYSAFIPSIEIDHIDTGETPYQGWKEKHSGEDMALFNRIKQEYINGTRDIYTKADY